jgi:predicted NBD/HSP70 family sugar kinase
MHILFDIGGTYTRVALYKGGDSFETPVIFETPQTYSDGIAKLIEVITGLVAEGKPDSITGGIAGIVDREKGELESSHNLPDWAGKPLSADLVDAFGTNVFLENDSAMVGLGEAHFGSGKGFSIVAYITISTGVGGARIVDGVIDEHVTGFEPGQQIIDIDGSVFGGSKNTNLGDYISGKAVEARMGKKPSEITDGAFWDDEAKALAYGLNNTIVHSADQ